MQADQARCGSRMLGTACAGEVLLLVLLHHLKAGADSDRLYIWCVISMARTMKAPQENMRA